MKRYSLYIFTIAFVFIALTLSVDHVLARKAATRNIIYGTVTYVVDGDTVHLYTPDQTKLRVRLYGIDAPETALHNGNRLIYQGQPFGEAAKTHLASMVENQMVALEIMSSDKHKRIVGILWHNNHNINMNMVRAGMAEAYHEYLQEPYRTYFNAAQSEARLASRGIWSDPAYERPSIYRKKHRIKGG